MHDPSTIALAAVSIAVFGTGLFLIVRDLVRFWLEDRRDVKARTEADQQWASVEAEWHDYVDSLPVLGGEARR